MAGAPRGRFERLARNERLARRSDFKHCYQHGLRQHGRYSILYQVPNETGGPRLGITVSKKVGNAAVRNRARRRIREIYRRSAMRPLLGALDLVVHARPGLASASFEELRREVERHLEKAARESRPRL